MKCSFKKGAKSMSNTPKNASERAFQDNFVSELKKYKWESPVSLNGNIQKVTVNDLINHWRTELISLEGFYTVARMREPNMLTKGTGKSKREEQDGWNGKIIPNALIAQFLYSEELNALDNKRNKIGELDMELTDLVEAAKVEDSKEYDALFDIVKRDKEDEPTDTFDKSRLTSELKSTDKKTDKYNSSFAHESQQHVRWFFYS